MVKSKNITAPKAKDTAKTPYNLKRFSAKYLPFRKEEFDPAIGLLSLIFLVLVELEQELFVMQYQLNTQKKYLI